MTETEMIETLRVEWKAAHEAKNVELMAKIEGELTDRVAAKNAPLFATLNEGFTAIKGLVEGFDSKLKRFMESRALPASQEHAVRKSFGNAFTDSDPYKAALTKTFGRHDRVSATVAQRIAGERKVITEAGSGFVIQPQNLGVFTVPPEQALKMRSLFTVIPVSSTNAIEYLEETWTYNADYQLLEGDKKAESTVVYVEKTANIRTIAHFVKISRQMWNDVPYVASTIDDRLIFGVLKKEDNELLYGAGGAGKITGLMEVAPIMAAQPAGSSVIDSVLKAIGVIGAEGYSATNIVMHPQMWASMQLTKTAQGVYVLGGPPASTAGLSLWGVPVTLVPQMNPVDVLVGQFPATAAIFDREAANVDIAFENEDDFIRNLICIRAEERIGFAVFAPKAYLVVPPNTP